MQIIAISVTKRVKEVPEVQQILTKYGENIISRLGLHNLGENKKNLIIVVYEGENVEEFITKLKEIEKVEVSTMKL